MTKQKGERPCLQIIHSGQQAIPAFWPAGNLFLLAKGQNIPPRQS